MKKLLLFLYVYTCLAGSLLAQKAQNSEEGNNQTFSIWIENDSLSEKDKDYTSGVRLAYTKEIQNIDGFTESLSHLLLPSLSSTPAKTNYSLGYSLTHLLFTPEDPFNYSQPVDQRRYAAWIGVGIALISQSDDHMGTLGLTIGATGTPALGEKIQDVIHDVTKSAKFNGWDNDIPSEATVGISWSHQQRFKLGDKHYLTPSLIMDLSTFKTQAAATLAWQYDLWRSQTPINTHFISSASFHPKFNNQQEHSLSFYTSISGFAIAHDATLDGSLFHHNATGNNREALVAQGISGIKYQNKKLSIALSFLQMTDAYSTQSEKTQMGSLQIGYAF